MDGKAIMMDMGQESARRRGQRCSSYQGKERSYLLHRSNSRSNDMRRELRSGIRRHGYVEEEEEEDPFFEKYFSKDLKSETATDVFQLVTSIFILAALLFTLRNSNLRDKKIWKLLLWQWEATALILMFGRFLSRKIFQIIVFFIQRSFQLRRRFLYLIYDLKSGIHNSIWLGLVLTVWYNLFDENVERDTNSTALRNVTKVLVCFLVGLTLLLGKSLLMKALISHFYMATYFDKALDSLFNRHLIGELSGLPNKSLYEEISIDLLHRLNPKNVSVWTVKMMMNIIQHGALFTLDEQIQERVESTEIESGNEAENAAAKIIFQNVAQPGSEYINLEDIERFIQKDEALKTVSLIEGGSENNKISESTLKRWVVRASEDWEALRSTLNNMSTIIDKLHLLMNVLVDIAILMLVLYILKIATGGFLRTLFYACSQLLVLAFIYGSTLKTTFEAVFFLFVIHPFDVGDICEIEEVEMKVVKINIFNTIFLRCDDEEECTITNKTLAGKFIYNVNRSPDIRDQVEFSIPITTTTDKIDMMERSIMSYISSNRAHFYPESNIIRNGIEELGRMKFQVFLKHKMNGRDRDERRKRSGNVLKEIAQILVGLEIINKIC